METLFFQTSHYLSLYKNFLFKMAKDSVVCHNNYVNDSVGNGFMIKSWHQIKISLLLLWWWWDSLQQLLLLLLLIDRKNKANLEAIEGAVFVLCLDQPPPHSTQSPSVMERPTSSVTARQCLHGDGTQYNSANRWFDKIIQVDVNCKIASSIPVTQRL